MPYELKVPEYAKAHGNVYGNEPTNYTAFLPKDKNVGTARAHRPDILFQIRNDNLRCVKPTGYLKDRGRIVLDTFDHGLRNFPELPVVLSSELEGSDIEYYYRQNGEIADYDLIGMLKYLLGLVVLQTNMYGQPGCPAGIWGGDLEGGDMRALLV